MRDVVQLQRMGMGKTREEKTWRRGGGGITKVKQTPKLEAPKAVEPVAVPEVEVAPAPPEEKPQITSPPLLLVVPEPVVELAPSETVPSVVLEVLEPATSLESTPLPSVEAPVEDPRPRRRRQVSEVVEPQPIEEPVSTEPKAESAPSE